MKKPEPPRFTIREENATAYDTLTEELFDAVETDGRGGCAGCHFFINKCWTACLNLPCNGDKWDNGNSRIWRKHQ